MCGSLQQDKQDLQAQLDTMGTFGEQAMPYLVADKLLGRQVVIVTEEGVDLRRRSRRRAGRSISPGAEILTTLTVRPTMAAGHRGTASTWRRCWGRRDHLAERADDGGCALARPVAWRSDPVGDLSGGPDELGELLSQGFLTRRLRISRTRR